MNAGWPLRRLVVLGVAGGLHDGLEGNLCGIPVLGVGGMSLEGGQETGYALHQTIVDLLLVLQGLDLVSPLLTLGMDLVLLGANEGALVDVGVDLDVGVVAKLEIVLCRE